ncbi:Synaptosomal-associated protein 29 [Orchesella cincta]|uniref:Synaptosomal-associated protein 29 n=1 Tax=Orchesella cincta TaxID=48709 RepID=A0A1D2MYX0_ORCCI|nr:Synaptosomal-associated protein 29 [Orchesella cincta]
MAGCISGQDKSSPPLGFGSTEHEDDVTFLGSGRRGYEPSSLEDRRQQLLEEKRRVEMKTLESTFRSLNVLNESEQIGNATAEELTRQREQLENADCKLDQISSSLKTSQRHIRGIKSWFGGIKNYFSNSNKPETTPIKSSASTSSDVDADKEQPLPRRSKLAEVLENRMEPPRDPVHPTERFRSNACLESKDVDELLDRNLDMMGDSLSRLKMLGLSLQDELGQQNELVDRITSKSENVDCKMSTQNKDMNRILKK